MAERRRLNSAQKVWCDAYEGITGFDALMEDFRAGNESFLEAARKSVSWFEDWSTDAHLKIGQHIPGEDEALNAEIEERATKPKAPRHG